MKNFKYNLLSYFFSFIFTTSANAKEKDFTVIDVRTTAEFQESHLKDSLHIDVLNDEFKSKVAKLDKNKSYKLYCRSGNRSGKALEIMKAQGFSNLENLGSLQQASKKTKISCEGTAC